jgi:type IV secretory pathway TrbF-like protein
MVPDVLPEPIAVATDVVAVLTRINVPYVIGGSFASSVHGEPRSTNDIDMVVDLRQHQVDAFIDLISKDCYVSRDAVVDAIRIGGAFNVIHIPTAIKVDVFVAASDVFDRERLRRRIAVPFGDDGESVMLFVDTAEDVILRKLEWYRRGGEASERQWRDVAGVIDAQAARLDRAYLREWAATLNVEDLLIRALNGH